MSAGYPPARPRSSRSASSGEDTPRPIGFSPVGRPWMPPRPVAPLPVPALPPRVAAAPGRPVAGARVAPRDAHVAGHRAEGVGRAVELLAVERAARRVPGLERGGPDGGVLAGERAQRR